jgi:hypothetical protein
MIRTAAALCGVLLATAVAAQGDRWPQTGPPGAAFVWLDGAYQNVALPAYGLGFFETSTVTFEQLRPVQTYNPRVSGAGVSGGVGVALPQGAVPGRNARLRFIIDFSDLRATDSGIATSEGNAAQLLNGFLVGPCGACTLPSTLHSAQRSWGFAVNATTEIPVGRVTVIPLIEILGGVATTHQAYAQERTPTGGGPTAFYDADTQMRWWDVGARTGLLLSVPITPMADVGLGGTIAVLHRHATLRGNDRFDDGFGFVYTSTLNVSRSTVAVVPGAQAHVAVRPSSNVEVKVFGGVERDNRVPGIVSPSFTPAEFVAIIPDGVQATPAGIGFSSLVTTYVGGRITAALTP